MALLIMEDIGLPGRCTRSLGHGENMVYQARSESYGPGWTFRVRWKEILVSLVYDQVQVATKYSQQDCRLDSLLDGIEEEVFDSK